MALSPAYPEPISAEDYTGLPTAYGGTGLAGFLPLAYGGLETAETFRILLEDGSSILLEDDSYILLEEAA